MLKIGDFSRLSGISIRMLRFYDETGLMVPAEVDPFTGYRYYKEEQLIISGRIRLFKKMGFSQAVISHLLENYEDREKLAEYLEIQRQELVHQKDNLMENMDILHKAIEKLHKGEKDMNYDVNFKVIPERYVASVRSVLPSYDQEGVLWGMMMKETAGLGLVFDNPALPLAIYQDGDYKETDVDVEIQTSVKGKYKDTEHVKFKKVPPVEIASAVYKGSYDKITEVNIAVAEWMRDHGYDFNGCAFSIYHVGRAETQNEEEFVTEVCYPVKKVNKRAKG